MTISCCFTPRFPRFGGLVRRKKGQVPPLPKKSSSCDSLMPQTNSPRSLGEANPTSFKQNSLNNLVHFNEPADKGIISEPIDDSSFATARSRMSKQTSTSRGGEASISGMAVHISSSEMEDSFASARSESTEATFMGQANALDEPRVHIQEKKFTLGEVTIKDQCVHAKAIFSGVTQGNVAQSIKDFLSYPVMFDEIVFAEVIEESLDYSKAHFKAKKFGVHDEYTLEYHDKIYEDGTLEISWHLAEPSRILQENSGKIQLSPPKDHGIDVTFTLKVATGRHLLDRLGIRFAKKDATSTLETFFRYAGSRAS